MAYVDFGDPIPVTSEAAAQYAQGGAPKREAIGTLLKTVRGGADRHRQRQRDRERKTHMCNTCTPD
jgi:hypothetical protein